MKKICLYLILLLAFIPTTIKAEEIDHFVASFKQQNNLVKDVKGSAIIGGNEVETNSIIDGFSIIMGNNVTYNGGSDYSAIIGNNLTIEGSFKDGIVLGNIIDFTNTSVIERDIVILGNDITISGTFNRNVIIYGSDIKLTDTTIGGNIKINAERLNIDENTIINGKLNLNSTIESNISNAASINDIDYYIVEEGNNKTFWEMTYSHIYKLVGLFVVFLAFLYFTPSILKKIIEKEDIFKIMGVGCIFLIIIPIISFILIMTAFGLSLGVLLLTFYLALLYLSTIITGYKVGYYLWDKYISKEKGELLKGMFGITIIYLLGLIPYVGPIVKFVTIIMGLGIVIKLFKKKKKN